MRSKYSTSLGGILQTVEVVGRHTTNTTGTSGMTRRFFLSISDHLCSSVLKSTQVGSLVDHAPSQSQNLKTICFTF